jgi:hypothetical protein
MIFKILSPKNLAKILAFLLKLLLVFEKMAITLVFEKTPIFSQKIGKIAENNDHNIEPRNPINKVIVVFHR